MSEAVQPNSIGPRNKSMLLSQLPLQELRPRPMTTASMEKKSHRVQFALKQTQVKKNKNKKNLCFFT